MLFSDYSNNNHSPRGELRNIIIFIKYEFIENRSSIMIILFFVKITKNNNNGYNMN